MKESPDFEEWLEKGRGFFGHPKFDQIATCARDMYYGRMFTVPKVGARGPRTKITTKVREEILKVVREGTGVTGGVIVEVVRARLPEAHRITIFTGLTKLARSGKEIRREGKIGQYTYFPVETTE